MMDRLLLCTDLDRTLLPNGSQLESARARAEAGAQKLENRLHCATGGPLGRNGNDAAGILEGVLHFHSGIGACLEDSR
jgi:hydroxymethylpyrimidine pyrophosphatase-like HAD family hydrolase